MLKTSKHYIQGGQTTCHTHSLSSPNFHPSSLIFHPSSFFLHPSSNLSHSQPFILHLSSRISHISSFILFSSSFILFLSSFSLRPSSLSLYTSSSTLIYILYQGDHPTCHTHSLSSFIFHPSYCILHTFPFILHSFFSPHPPSYLRLEFETEEGILFNPVFQFNLALENSLQGRKTCSIFLVS